MTAYSSARLENLKKYLSEDPQDSFLRYALAMEFMKLEGLTQAAGIFKELIADDPDYLATYYQYGKLLEENGTTEEAIEIYKLGLKIAEIQNNTRTVKELRQAILALTDNEDEME